MPIGSIALAGPIDSFLLKILNDPLLLVMSVFALIILVFGGYGAYLFLFQTGEKSVALKRTEELLDNLEYAADLEGNPHGGQSAQGLLDEWEEIKGNLSGERGIMQIKKFNMKAETFLWESGYYQEEE